MHMTPELRQEVEGLLADLKKHLELNNGDLSALEASNAAISKLWNDPTSLTYDLRARWQEAV